MTLAGQVAFVAGAAGPLGRSTAVALAEAGADIALCANENTEPAVFAINSIANELWALGRRHLTLPIDPSRPAAAAEAVSRALSELGRLDLLVTLPEALPYAGARAEASERDLLDHIQHRIGGVLLLCNAAGAAMLERGRGSILNVVSANGRDGDHGAAVAAAEAGVAALTRSLALGWGGRICVNAASLRDETRPEQLSALAAQLATSPASGQLFDL